MQGYLRTIFRVIGNEKEWAGIMTWQLDTSIVNIGLTSNYAFTKPTCWNLACEALSESFRLPIFSYNCLMRVLFELGGGGVIFVQSIYWAPTKCWIPWWAELGRQEESKRHGPCQKRTHNLVLALEWSEAIFSCMYCWDLGRAFSSFYISKLILNSVW